MLESSEYDDRRLHPRTSVSSGVIAVLITCCPEIIGSVSDISLGGAKVVYHHPENTKIDCSAIKIDLISDDRYVEAIPCSNAWDNAVETSDFFAADDLRQCGIQFDELTPNQLFLLRGFINRCATQIHPEKSSVETPFASNL